MESLLSMNYRIAALSPTLIVTLIVAVSRTEE
jgi:hypothetical protein